MSKMSEKDARTPTSPPQVTLAKWPGLSKDGTHCEGPTKEFDAILAAAQKEVERLKARVEVEVAARNVLTGARKAYEQREHTIREALRPAINMLNSVGTSYEKLSGRYCGHKANNGHPWDWVLTVDAENAAFNMSPQMCGFLSACANAVREAQQALHAAELHSYKRDCICDYRDGELYEVCEHCKAIETRTAERQAKRHTEEPHV